MENNMKNVPVTIKCEGSVDNLGYGQYNAYVNDMMAFYGGHTVSEENLQSGDPVIVAAMSAIMRAIDASVSRGYRQIYIVHYHEWINKVLDKRVERNFVAGSNADKFRKYVWGMVDKHGLDFHYEHGKPIWRLLTEIEMANLKEQMKGVVVSG